MMKDTIRCHYDRAHDLAMIEVINMARKILRDHPKFTKFTMAMGIYGFNFTAPGARESTSWPLECSIVPMYMRRLVKFISHWDDVLKLTGDAVTFSATGPIIRRW